MRPCCNVLAPPWIVCCRRWIDGRQEEFFQGLHRHHYNSHHCSPLLHPVPVGFGSRSRGSMMGLLPDARGSYSSWNSTSGRESMSTLVCCLSGKDREWANTVWSEGDAALDHCAENVCLPEEGDEGARHHPHVGPAGGPVHPAGEPAVYPRTSGAGPVSSIPQHLHSDANGAVRCCT